MSTTASSNSPAGSETPQDGDNYIRTLSAFIALLRDKLDGSSNTGTITNATFSGTMAGAASWAALQTFAAGISVGGTTFTSLPTAGTYTPTLGGSPTNVASTTIQDAFYVRIGSVVIVFGALVVDPTSAGAVTSFTLSLPIASTLGASWNLCGVGSWTSTPSGAAINVGIDADSTNNRAQFLFYTTSSALSATLSYVYGYRVL